MTSDDLQVLLAGASPASLAQEAMAAERVAAYLRNAADGARLTAGGAPEVLDAAATLERAAEILDLIRARLQDPAALAVNSPARGSA
jgi:hypothetical protein